MSKLPKAPLIEVVFELRWKVYPNEFQTIQYLPGDLYPHFKNKYPFREVIEGIPLFGQAPSSRFRTGQNDYPLIQIGSGIFTVNTNDTKYFWDEYESSVIEAIQKLTEVYSFKENHNVTLTLRYIDFIKFDFDKENVLEFLDKKLHIKIAQSFYDSNELAKNLFLNLNYRNELGALNVAINQGKDSLNVDGIIIQTNVTSNVISSTLTLNEVKIWLNQAHEVTSDIFKKMTKGYLQEEFASK
jgi:uncharacterized protein (TIGR04255 family)